MAKKAKAAEELLPTRSPEEVFTEQYPAILAAKNEAEAKAAEAKKANGSFRALMKSYKKAGGDQEALNYCLAIRKLEPQDVERHWRNINKHAKWMNLPIGTQLGMFDNESVATQIENEQIGNTPIDKPYHEGRAASGRGENRETCPYKAKRLRDKWLEGWDDDQQERVMALGPKEPEPVA